MKNLLLLLIPLSILFHSCEKSCPTNLSISPVSPIYYEEANAIYPIFEWESNLSDEDFILETSKYANYEEIHERATVNGTFYQSEKVYNDLTHYYWRLRSKSCDDFLVDEVFNASSYFDVIEGEYEANNGTRIILAKRYDFNNNQYHYALINGDIIYPPFETKNWSDDTIELKAFYYASAAAGYRLEIDATIIYDVDKQEIEATGEYYLNNYGQITSDILSFKGTKVN